MNHIDVRPFEYDLNPNDLLFLDRAPKLDPYLRAWFAYCDAQKIDYGLPRVQDVFPNTSPIGSKTLFWLPRIGITRVGALRSCWAFKEPYAHLGASTSTCTIYDLDLIASDQALSPALRHVYQDLAISCTQHHRSKQVDRYKQPQPEDERVNRELTSYQTASPAETIGAIAFFERGGVFSASGMAYYIDATTEELLARTVMSQHIKCLCDSTDVRVLRGA